MLGVSESIIDTTPQSKNLDASEKYYTMTSIREESRGYFFCIRLSLLLTHKPTLLLTLRVGGVSIQNSGSLF